MSLGVPVEEKKPCHRELFSAGVPCLVIKKVRRGGSQ
jgi:hypothetical protein